MLLAIIVIFFSTIPSASAMCPLCVAGAAIGLSIARYYGISDIVVGIWLGALAISTALWINNIIKKRVRLRPFHEVMVIIAVIIATIVPFYSAGFFNGMTGMVDTIFGINMLAFGTVIGSIITFAGAPISNFIKRRRRAVFPYQTVLLTFILLVLFSLLFWYVTTYYLNYLNIVSLSIVMV